MKTYHCRHNWSYQRWAIDWSVSVEWYRKSTNRISWNTTDRRKGTWSRRGEREKQRLFVDRYELKITMWYLFYRSIEIWRSVARRQYHQSWPSLVIACNLECSHQQSCTERYQVARSVDTVCVVFSSHRSHRDSISKRHRSIPDYVEVTTQWLIIKHIQTQWKLLSEKIGSVTHL